MDDIKELLKSPVFWFASVFVAFVMSYLAAVARDWVAHIIGKVSARQQERNKARESRIAQLAEALEKDRYAQVLFRVEILQLKLREVLYLLVSYIFMGFAFFLIITGLPRHGLITLLVSVVTFLVIAFPISRRLKFLGSVFRASIKGGLIEHLLTADPNASQKLSPSIKSKVQH